MNYQEFLVNKQFSDRPSGFSVGLEVLNPNLMAFQKAQVRWALARGRAALFNATGLGKTIMQLEWANQVSKQGNDLSVLILAPLAVAEQTRSEGDKFGIPCRVISSKSDVKGGINILNYEKLHKIDSIVFSGIVLDESSIMKSFSGVIRNQIISMFRDTPFRLSCSATPAPNDWTEIGNQSEFLGILTQSEMKSIFFINDSGDTGKWRLKGHAQENLFWKWLASWAAVVSMPSDLGFEDDGFILPPLRYVEHILPTESSNHMGFFPDQVSGLHGRRRVRRETLDVRCQAAADLINATDDRWLVWCHLNDEGTQLTKLIKGAEELAGRHSDEEKKSRLLRFAEGRIKRLVTKPDIAGFGLNFQSCSRAAFVGLNDSWESMFQAVRRIWRYKQDKSCDVHFFLEEREGPILENLKRKDRQAQQMACAMIEQMKNLVRREVFKASKEQDMYNPSIPMEIPQWMP
jgi:hypothetical protein